MPLSSVAFGSVANANDVNQIIDILQRNAGETETGKYFLTFTSQTSGYYGGVYIPTLSFGSTPVSVTIDTSDTAPYGFTSPTTTGLTQYGFQIYAQSNSGGNGNARCGGFWTVQF